MKLSTGLIFAAIAFVAVKYLGNLGVGVSTVQFLINGFQINSATDYVVNILVQNVSNATAPINAMTGTISINGNVVGNISDFQPVTVNPTSQAQINVHVTPNLLALPGAVLNLINQPGSALDIVVAGNANVNGLVIPFSVENTITI